METILLHCPGVYIGVIVLGSFPKTEGGRLPEATVLTWGSSQLR